MLSVFENVYDHRSQSHNSESVGEKNTIPIYTLKTSLQGERANRERNKKKKKINKNS